MVNLLFDTKVVFSNTLQIYSVNKKQAEVVALPVCVLRFISFQSLQRRVHVRFRDLLSEQPRRDETEQHRDKRRQYVRPPVDVRKTAEVYQPEHEVDEHDPERDTQYRADKAHNIDLSENIPRDLVIVIPEHHQRRDLSVPFAYVDIREVINDQRAQRRREHEQRDRDRDQRSRVLPEHSAIQKPHTRKHEYRRTDHGDNRHKKPTFEQQHVPHRRFVFETQPFPDKRYPFDQNFLPRFRRFGRKQYSGFIPHRLHSAKPGKQRNADEGYPERYQIVRKFDPRRERGHRILPLYYYNGSRVKKQVPSRGRT